MGTTPDIFVLLNTCELCIVIQWSGTRMMFFFLLPITKQLTHLLLHNYYFPEKKTWDSQSTTRVSKPHV